MKKLYISIWRYIKNKNNGTESGLKKNKNYILNIKKNKIRNHKLGLNIGVYELLNLIMQLELAVYTWEKYF